MKGGTAVRRGPHRRLHAARHTAASRLIAAGATPSAVAAWLGHADGGTLVLRSRRRRDTSQSSRGTSYGTTSDGCQSDGPNALKVNVLLSALTEMSSKGTSTGGRWNLGRALIRMDRPGRHEHACVQYPMLHVNPKMIPRLDELEKDLEARMERAEIEAWTGEIEGIQFDPTVYSRETARWPTK